MQSVCKGALVHIRADLQESKLEPRVGVRALEGLYCKTVEKLPSVERLLPKLP